MPSTRPVWARDLGGRVSGDSPTAAVAEARSGSLTRTKAARRVPIAFRGAPQEVNLGAVRLRGESLDHKDYRFRAATAAERLRPVSRAIGLGRSPAPPVPPDDDMRAARHTSLQPMQHGLWRSKGCRHAFAMRRPGVRIPSAPPNRKPA